MTAELKYSSASTEVVYATDSAATDLTRDFTLPSVATNIAFDPLRRPSAQVGAVEQVPCAVGYSVTSQAIWDTAMRGISDTDRDGWICVLNNDSDSGWIIPAVLMNKVDAGANLNAATGRVTRARATFAQRRGDEPWLLSKVQKVSANGSVNLGTVTGRLIAIATTLGTYGSHTIGVGYNSLATINNAATNLTVTGFRGWLAIGTAQGIR